MKKAENSAEDILSALFGAALLSSLAEQEKEAKPDIEVEQKPEPTSYQKSAQELKAQYDAFIEVGFTEEQATMFAAAILS